MKLNKITLILSLIWGILQFEHFHKHTHTKVYECWTYYITAVLRLNIVYGNIAIHTTSLKEKAYYFYKLENFNPDGAQISLSK